MFVNKYVKVTKMGVAKGSGIGVVAVNLVVNNTQKKKKKETK